MRKRIYPSPSKIACIEGKSHSIGIFSGVCFNCKKQFFLPDKKEEKRFNKVFGKDKSKEVKMGWAVMTEEWLKSQVDKRCSYCGKKVKVGDAFYTGRDDKLIHRGCAWEKEEKRQDKGGK